jgi:hypothetical protein
MEDPLPENISGQKRVIHTVNHDIQWGYVAIGLAVILLALKFGPPIRNAAAGDDEENEMIGG